jgi:membrane protein YqaA with SNARE-associated domain
MKPIRKIYDWMGNKVDSGYANIWLAVLFFIEAVFFIPVDPLLIIFCISNNKRSFFYAAVATISSVAGGIFGYTIGSLMWKSVGLKMISWIISESAFNQAVLKYKLYQNWAVLIAGFTPLPYKAITLSAGFCNLPLIPFIVFSLISRGARFFLLAGTIHIWGSQIKNFIDRYFNQLVILFTVILVFSFWLLK